MPLEGFRYFKQGTRTVDDAGLVQVDSSYYAALPAAPHSEVTVRIFERSIEILDPTGQLLRRHEKAARKGKFAIEQADRIFNPSRESRRVLAKAERIGAHAAALAREMFARLGRPGQRAIYGLANLARHYPCADIDAVCARLLDAQVFSYAAVKRALERKATIAAAAGAPATDLTQTGPAHSCAHRIPNVLGNPLRDSPTGGLRWQCLSLNSNDRCAHFASPA